jgi:biotin carboxyl carrier protein
MGGGRSDAPGTELATEAAMSMRRYTVSIDDRSFVIDVVETAADRFEVSVDGQTFEATLHGDHDLPGSVISPEITSSEARTGGLPLGGLTPTAPGPTPASSPQPGSAAPTSVPAIRRPPTSATGGAGRSDVLTAPMPGVVLEVLVAVGAALKRGDPILVLEAMKMRNTIRCPRDAVVVEVAVAAGQPVGPGDLLVRLGDASG